MNAALRPYRTTGLTLLGAGIIAFASVTAPVTAPSAQLARQSVKLTAGETGYVVNSPNDLVGLIVGGTGTPIPPQSYVDVANELYIQRILPGATSIGVFTPEGGSPFYTGVKSLTFDQSFAQGATMLETYIKDNVAAGNTVAVSGVSQSSTISGMVMSALEKDGVAADAVKFFLVGDPSNPDGGLLERFNGLSLPSLGISFSGATPPDTIYDTDIYSLEYDGFADFPKYPLNFLADLNAFLGIQMVHPLYKSLTPEQFDNAIHLQTTSDYDGVTNYYMIPHDSLPLADLIRQIPLIGKPLGDLLEPDLTQLVNLGYDNPLNEGWDATGQANVPTEFGLFPSIDQVMVALKNLGTGTEQGIQAFMTDLAHPDSLLPQLGESSGSGAGDLLSSPTEIVNALTAAFAQAYALLLPTADIATALAVTMPTYDLSLFTEHLFSNPVDAIGLPIAADVGLITLSAGIEFMTIQHALSVISSELSGLF